MTQVSTPGQAGKSTWAKRSPVYGKHRYIIIDYSFIKNVSLSPSLGSRTIKNDKKDDRLFLPALTGLIDKLIGEKGDKNLSYVMWHLAGLYQKSISLVICAPCPCSQQ